VGEGAIDANSEYLDTELLKFRVFDGDRRQLGGSDAGEISRVKTEHHPLTSVIGEVYLPSNALMVRFQAEIRCLFAYLYCHFRYLRTFLWD
jgi:hypothetical protein